MNETLFTNGYIFYGNVLIEICFVYQYCNIYCNVYDMNETLFTNGYIFY